MMMPATMAVARVKPMERTSSGIGARTYAPFTRAAMTLGSAGKADPVRVLGEELRREALGLRDPFDLDGDGIYGLLELSELLVVLMHPRSDLLSRDHLERRHSDCHERPRQKDDHYGNLRKRQDVMVHLLLP
jgi:hypothetical protein